MERERRLCPELRGSSSACGGEANDKAGNGSADAKTLTSKTLTSSPRKGNQPTNACLRVNSAPAWRTLSTFVHRWVLADKPPDSVSCPRAFGTHWSAGEFRRKGPAGFR